MAAEPARSLTPAEKQRLSGPVLSTPFDIGQRMYASWQDGRVFDYGSGDARQLRDMLRTDGGARKVDQVLTLPLRSAAWEIRKAPGGDAEYNYIRAQFDNLLGKVIDQATTAVVYRKAFFELEYALDTDGAIAVKGIHYRPPATCEQGFDGKTGEPEGFRQRIANPGGLLVVQQGTAKGDAPGYVRIPQDRAFVYTHGAYREPIDGMSDLDVAYWVFETKRKVQFLLFQFLEQQSLPKIVARGADSGAAQRNADAIADAGASGVVGLEFDGDPTARVFEVIESSGKGAQQFLDAIAYLDGQMSASVLAGFTDLAGISAHSSTGSGGSYALSADQSEFFLAARQAAADEIAEQISDGLFRKLCELEFGTDCKPPTLEIGPLSKRDKDRAMGMLNSLLTADHYNAPPGLIDLLIKSTAGYLGLPVDKVAQLVDDHPAKDPAETAAGSVPAAEPAADPAAPTGQAGGSVADDPMAQFKQLAGLSNVVALAHELVSRARAGENPQTVLHELALTRHVRTAAGVKRYGLPIGSPIGPKAVELADLKAKADKLGPNSGAATAYNKALAARNTAKAKADKLGPASGAAAAYRNAYGEPPAATGTNKKKLTLNDLAKAAGTKKESSSPPATVTKLKPKLAKPVTTPPRVLSKSDQKASLEGLPATQTAALRLYSGDDYKPINRGLRAGKPPKKYQRAIADIDAALDAKPLPNPTKVWRTVGGDAFGIQLGDDASVLKGRVFTEAGFFSSSIKNEQFPTSPPPVHLTVQVPAGVGGAYIDPISQNQGENELLLPRNLRYVITRTRWNPSKQRWDATARVLPPAVAQAA